MKTNVLVLRSPASHRIVPAFAEKKCPTPWKTNFSCLPLTAIIPLYRYSVVSSSWSSVCIHPWSMAMFTSPSIFADMEDIAPSCRGTFVSPRKYGSNVSILSRSKAPMLRSSEGGTFPCSVRNIGAVALSERSRFSIISSSSSPLFLPPSLSSSIIRSILFRIILSAKHTCCSASFSVPSALSSSSLWRMCFASATVMMLSSLYILSRDSSPSFVSAKKVWTTGAGSARPVVSMMTPSNVSTFSYRRFRAATRSPRTLQQMHPFMISITSSSTLSDRIL
mmetsp:Transcript_20505/g.49301  ORF Transcript_20505/g.49301 Transcript_20505/m.49301 type:complete len:279 (-) Transcript_20505:266-1102(-)